jgi:uncharacterized membrane protein YidH (DUF202 family)
VSTPHPDHDLGDQEGRTLLAWRRTALSLVAAGALIGHLATDPAGSVAVAVVLAGLGGVVAFAWLSPGRRVGAAGFALVVGVLLLSGLALLSLAYRQ